jgi:hypothetical protein
MGLEAARPAAGRCTVALSPHLAGLETFLVKESQAEEKKKPELS